MIDYKLCTIEESIDLLDKENPVFFDVETVGLYGKISLAQLYQEGLGYVILISYPDTFILAVELNEYNLVMHNASYEISTLQTQTFTPWIPKQFEDTFYLARLMYPLLPDYSLDSVAEVVLGYDPYVAASLDKPSLQKSDWSGVLSEDQIHYACMDVFHLLDVYNAVKDKRSDYSYKLDMITVKHCLDFQVNGMPIIQERVGARFRENILELEDIALPINSNSFKQVRAYIEEDESDALALARFISGGNDRAARVSKTRKLLKQNNYLSKYCKPAVHGRFSPSARSGRVICNKDNLQQIPRKLRKCFGYSEGGDTVLVMADYPTIELRCVTAIAGDTNMAKMFVDGIDVHGHTARSLFGPLWTKEHRTIAKCVNFNLLFGGGAGVVQDILLKDAGVYMSLGELEKKKAKWHKLWPGITKWQRSTTVRWRAGETASTPMGRVYKGIRMTDHLNIMVQGFAAEVAKLALHRLMAAIEKLDTRIKLLNFMHDNFILSCPNEQDLYIELSRVLANTMQEAWFESQFDLKIPNLPMPIDSFVGYTWGTIETDGLYRYTSKGTRE